MHDVLKGTKVLITRPSQQAKNLSGLIEAHGGIVSNLPTVDIQVPDDIEKVNHILNDLSKFHIGIFVSRNAVLYAQQLPAFNKDKLQNLDLFAIGAGTAEQLKKVGIKNATYAGGRSNSESLLEFAELTDSAVKGKNIIIFRGQGGRELLADTLRARGANIEYAEVYKRVRPSYDRHAIDDAWSNDGPDVIVVTSNEILQNLFDMLNEEQQANLLHKQLITISERVVDLAMKLGVKKKVFLAEETSDAGIYAGIVKLVEQPSI